VVARELSPEDGGEAAEVLGARDWERQPAKTRKDLLQLRKERHAAAERARRNRTEANVAAYDSVRELCSAACERLGAQTAAVVALEEAREATKRIMSGLAVIGAENKTCADAVADASAFISKGDVALVPQRRVKARREPSPRTLAARLAQRAAAAQMRASQKLEEARAAEVRARGAAD
jgi:hypothetical protein